MDPITPKPDGWIDQLRRIIGSVLGLARGRVELFAVELQEEKLRLLHVAVWFAVAAVFGTAGLLLALGALAIWLWEIASYLGLILLAAVTIGIAVIIFFSIRARIKTELLPFRQTIEEFRKDGECFTKNK